jgi:hypothetical protein
MGGPHEDESTEAGRRGEATRNREEGSESELDRRGCVAQLSSEVNQQWKEPRVAAARATDDRRHDIDHEINRSLERVGLLVRSSGRRTKMPLSARTSI